MYLLSILIVLILADTKIIIKNFLFSQISIGMQHKQYYFHKCRKSNRIREFNRMAIYIKQYKYRHTLIILKDEKKRFLYAVYYFRFAPLLISIFLSKQKVHSSRHVIFKSILNESLWPNKLKLTRKKLHRNDEQNKYLYHNFTRSPCAAAYYCQQQAYIYCYFD